MQLAHRLRPALGPEQAALVSWRTLTPPLLVGLTCTVLIGLIAVSWGVVRIPPQTTASVLLDQLPFVSIGAYTEVEEAIIWDVRAPRVVLAGLVGATLAFAGAAYQGVFRNPLAEPYLIGVAAGASVGATLIIVSPLYVTAGLLSPLPPAAFAGAIIAVAMSYGLARTGGAVPTASLILRGVAVSAVGTSFVTYLMLTYQERTIEILNWVLGGFNTARWVDSAIALPYLIAAAAMILPYARVLNVLQLEEEDARQLGVDVERVKLVVLAAASLATAAAVAVSGLIGFVGLVVPHAVRMIWGPDHRRLLPLSACLGASFLILADIAARSIDPGREVPIGIVTAFAGAPFVLYLMRRSAQSTFGRRA